MNLLWNFHSLCLQAGSSHLGSELSQAAAAPMQVDRGSPWIPGLSEPTQPSGTPSLVPASSHLGTEFSHQAAAPMQVDRGSPWIPGLSEPSQPPGPTSLVPGQAGSGSQPLRPAAVNIHAWNPSSSLYASILFLAIWWSSGDITLCAAAVSGDGEGIASASHEPYSWADKSPSCWTEKSGSSTAADAAPIRATAFIMNRFYWSSPTDYPISE